MWPIILVSRSWLVWAPLLVAWQVGAAWAADRWSSWEWLRVASVMLAWAMAIGVAVWALASAVIVTRRGFWVPFEGRGRWAAVVARDDLTVTLRVGAKYGLDNVVSFDRVEEWPAMARILDARLPADLPGVEVAEPHPQWRTGLQERADDLIRRVSLKVTPPASERAWLRPEDRPFAVHRLQLTFQPAVDGARVQVRFGDEWNPEIRVDGGYAYLPDAGPDEEAGDDPESADEALAAAAGILAAVFLGADREPLPAWRIRDDQGKQWDFYPRPQI